MKELRKKLGMTLQQLSDKTGIHTVTLSRIETGRINIKNVTLKNALKLAEALGCEPRELISR